MVNPISHWPQITFGTRFLIPLRGLSSFQGIRFRISLRGLSGFQVTLGLVVPAESAYFQGQCFKCLFDFSNFHLKKTKKSIRTACRQVYLCRSTNIIPNYTWDLPLLSHYETDNYKNLIIFCIIVRYSKFEYGLIIMITLIAMHQKCSLKKTESSTNKPHHLCS